MIKKTIENVRIVKHITCAMWIFCSAATLALGYLAANGQFADHIALGIILSALAPTCMMFWFSCYHAVSDIEQEMIDTKTG